MVGRGHQPSKIWGSGRLIAHYNVVKKTSRGIDKDAKDWRRSASSSANRQPATITSTFAFYSIM